MNDSKFSSDETLVVWNFPRENFPFLREQVCGRPMTAKRDSDGRIIIAYSTGRTRRGQYRFFYLMPRDFDPNAGQWRDWIEGAVKTSSIAPGRATQRATQGDYAAAQNLSPGQREKLAAIFKSGAPKNRSKAQERFS